MAIRIVKTLTMIGLVALIFYCEVWADGAPPPDQAGLPQFRECPLIDGDRNALHPLLP